MDSEFIENCRLLKKHFTKLTQADTTAESRQDSTRTDVAADIINEAKKLLFYEQLDALSDKDIEAIRQNSVIKYAKTLENYIPKESCQKNVYQKNRLHWNDDIFRAPPPNPKRNLQFGKSNLHTILENQTDNKENDEGAESFLDFSDISQMTLEDEINGIEEDWQGCGNKHWNIEEVFKVKDAQYAKFYGSRNKTLQSKWEKYDKIDNEIEEMKKQYAEMEEITKKNMRKKDAKRIECLQNVMTNEKEAECVTKMRRENLTTDGFRNMPELKIIPQQKLDIMELLEVKKLHMENIDNQSFDMNHTKCQKNFILKSALHTWRRYVKDSKMNSVKTKMNSKKIENFLETLQKFKLTNTQKSKSDLSNTEKKKKDSKPGKIKPKSCGSTENKISSFEYRFKAQKDIIAMQKAKLEEQNVLIEELKLNKIRKAVKESLERAQSDLQKTVQQSTMYKYRLKSDPKPVMEDVNIDPIGLNFSLNLSKAPKIVQMMEERAKEREEKRLLIKERKRLIEEEKKRIAEEAIQRKIKEESNEKQVRVEKARRQRELTRQLEMRRQWEKKRFITINQIAYEHYRRKLMKNYGMKHFKMLIYRVKINMEIGKRFYENNVIMRCYKSWKTYARGIVTGKTNKAVSLYDYKIKLKLMNAWRKIHFAVVQRCQVAIDWYEMSLQNKIFINWHRVVCEYHIQYTVNVRQADQHYRKVLLFQCLHYWRSLPEIIRIERIQNERKRKWRLRVAEILSDYDPLKNYE